MRNVENALIYMHVQTSTVWLIAHMCLVMWPCEFCTRHIYSCFYAQSDFQTFRVEVSRKAHLVSINYVCNPKHHISSFRQFVTFHFLTILPRLHPLTNWSNLIITVIKLSHTLRSLIPFGKRGLDCWFESSDWNHSTFTIISVVDCSHFLCILSLAFRFD